MKNFSTNPQIRSNDNLDFLETLAELEHEQWVEWSQSLAKVIRIPNERLEKWKKLWIKYQELPEEEKDKDRKYAMRVIEALKINDKTRL